MKDLLLPARIDVRTSKMIIIWHLSPFPRHRKQCKLKATYGVSMFSGMVICITGKASMFFHQSQISFKRARAVTKQWTRSYLKVCYDLPAIAFCWVFFVTETDNFLSMGNFLSRKSAKQHAISKRQVRGHGNLLKWGLVIAQVFKVRKQKLLCACQGIDHQSNFLFTHFYLCKTGKEKEA